MRVFILVAKVDCLLPEIPPKTEPMTLVEALQDLENIEPRPMTGKVKLPNGKWILHHNSEGTKLPDAGELFSLSQHHFCPAVLRQRPLKHYAHDRLLTIFEIKRLQTFPDDYDLSGSIKDMKDQLGNAVPCALARSVAQSLMACHMYELVPHD
jgi:site-specific DNA-cytosine methylase